MAKQKHTVKSLKSILTSIRAHDTKNIDFPVVVEAFYNKKIIEISKSNDDIALVSSLHNALNSCVQAVKQNPIQSKRPNEVGNYIEQPVIDAINATQGLSASKPSNLRGNKQSTGYPDILVMDHKGRPTYLEVKTYNINNVGTTQRSFYLSPSDDPKVIHDARHLTVGFEIQQISSGVFVPQSYKLIDLYDLPCDIKF